MKTAMQELIDELESIKGYKYGGLVIRLISWKQKYCKEINRAHAVSLGMGSLVYCIIVWHYITYQLVCIH